MPDDAQQEARRCRFCNRDVTDSSLCSNGVPHVFSQYASYGDDYVFQNSPHPTTYGQIERKTDCQDGLHILNSEAKCILCGQLIR